jgi:hypothetical protein
MVQMNQKQNTDPSDEGFFCGDFMISPEVIISKISETSQKKDTKFTSVGKVGPSRRGKGENIRLYINSTKYGKHAQDVIDHIDRVFTIGKKFEGRVRRSITRGIVSKEAFLELRKSPWKKHIEAAIPLDGLRKEKAYLVYIAQNRTEEKPLTLPEPLKTQLREKKQKKLSHPQKEEKLTPRQIVEKAKNEGYTFSNSPTKADLNQIMELWGDTFGWTEEEARTFIQTMAEQSDRKKIHQHDRKLWFSVMKQDGEIVSMALAEKIALKGPNGDVPIIESTEWVTKPGKRGGNKLPAVAAYLKAQILEDMDESPNGMPVIIAECNTISGAVNAAEKIEMKPASKKLGSQRLMRNTEVEDGIKHPKGKYRDFKVVYLNKKTIKKYYNKIHRSAMMDELAA